MYRRIAVPLDGTSESEHAIRWAVTLAGRAGCPVELVHAAFPRAEATELYGIATLHDQPPETSTIQHRLRVIADEIATLGIPTDVVMLDDAVTSALTDHLRTSRADLIVMTTHDRNRLERFLLGSVAESLMKGSHIPALLVRSRPGLVEIRSLPTISHVLVPHDGSALASAILPHVAQFAALMHAEITLLSVMQPVLAVVSAGPEAGAALSIPLSKAPADSDAVAHEPPEVGSAAARLRSMEGGLVTHTAAIVDGHPARAIVEYATQHSVDLIAMTTHGRGALKRLVAGSVATSVLRTTDLPMLIFRPRTS